MKPHHLFLLALVGNISSGWTSGGELNSLSNATDWINSPPLSAASLRGKVVLVDFWTYTCINWRRTLPYVRAWADKYKTQGLVVIGVHSPEFPFERDLINVRQQAEAQRVGYPIAVDNGMAIWRAFDNSYWPALYLIDGQGKVRYHRFGEGAYAEIERMIQQLLAESSRGLVPQDLVSVDPQGAEAQPDLSHLGSQENYAGVDRTEGFASPGGAVAGKQHSYNVPTVLSVNHWALSGDWTMSAGSITLNKPLGRIVFRFHARDLHLVMGPDVRGHSLRFRVRIDGMPPGTSHGVDVDEQGLGTLDQQRMYQLIRQRGAIRDRLFEIEFLDAGADAFSFTFG